MIVDKKLVQDDPPQEKIKFILELFNSNKLIDAKIKANNEAGNTEPLDTSNGSIVEREAHYMSEAIISALTEADFTITQLKASVVLEDLKIPPQAANIQPTVTSTDIPFPAGAPEPAVQFPLNGGTDGVLTNDIIVDKNGGETGILESTGYVYIGEDPDSQDGFDVEDEDGQRTFTTVKLIRDDIEDLL